MMNALHIKTEFRLRIGMLVFCAVLSGCAHVPKNDQEYRSGALNGKLDGKKKEFIVSSIDLEMIKSRLQKFSDKCLNQTIATQQSEINSYNGAMVSGVSTNRNKYRSHMESSKDHIALYMQMDPVSENSGTHDIFGVMPKQGVYFFLVDVTATEKPREFKIVTFLTQAAWGNVVPESILDDAESWIKKTGAFCPKLE